LQCVAVRSKYLLSQEVCVAACCRLLQCIAACCSVLQHVVVSQQAERRSTPCHKGPAGSAHLVCAIMPRRCFSSVSSIHFSVCCSVLQCDAVCCSVLQCVAVYCSGFYRVAMMCVDVSHSFVM